MTLEESKVTIVESSCSAELKRHAERTKSLGSQSMTGPSESKLFANFVTLSLPVLSVAEGSKCDALSIISITLQKKPVALKKRQPAIEFNQPISKQLNLKLSQQADEAAAVLVQVHRRAE